MALGQIALAWNGLHSQLALLFCSLMGGGYVNQFLGIWHALKNDAAQRDILEAAARGSRHNQEYGDEFGAKILAEVQWIVGQARAVEDRRNDALHSPLWGEDGMRYRVLPVTGLGHRRAQKLADAAAVRGLLAEFRWCRDAALILTEYARQLDEAMTGRGPGSWPDRPSLPSRGQTKNAATRRQSQKPKSRRRPQPSQE